MGMTTFILWGTTLSITFARAEKTLWLPYGLHLGINLGFSMLGWFFLTEPHAPQWWLGNPALAPESGVLGIMIWSCLALIAYLITGKKRITDLLLS